MSSCGTLGNPRPYRQLSFVPSLVSFISEWSNAHLTATPGFASIWLLLLEKSVLKWAALTETGFGPSAKSPIPQLSMAWAGHSMAPTASDLTLLCPMSIFLLGCRGIGRQESPQPHAFRMMEMCDLCTSRKTPMNTMDSSWSLLSPEPTREATETGGWEQAEAEASGRKAKHQAKAPNPSTALRFQHREPLACC